MGADAFDGGLPDGVFRTADLAGTRAVLVHFQCYIFVWNVACAVRKAAVKGGGVFVSVTASGTGGRNVFCRQNGAGRLYRDPSAGRKNPQRSACRADLDVSDGAGLHEKIRWLEAVGSFSLELYLCHMFVFYRVVNDWLPQQENVVQIVAAATIAVALAWVIHMLFDLLWKAAAALSGR